MNVFFFKLIIFWCFIRCFVCFFSREIAEEEVNHLFAASDDDHDNLLTFDEVLDKHEIFVGSEATDYGEHLHNIHYFQDELWKRLLSLHLHSPSILLIMFPAVCIYWGKFLCSPLLPLCLHELCTIFSEKKSKMSLDWFILVNTNADF